MPMINILLLGLVSFFSDVSSEMVYPLIPLYLTSAFGATPGLVGIIEGIAESAASLLKVFSGYVSDKYKSKKPIAFAGYGTGLIYKLALIIAGSWPGILAARVIDRIGKGIRTAPRDVLVSESAEASRSGQAFGLHKAMDMAGSALGIFLSYLLLKYGSGEFKRVFLISAIPAALGLAALIFVKEKREKKEQRERVPFWKNLSGLDRSLKLYLLVAFLFTLGNSSNTFLLLKAKNVGFNDTSVILLYFAYNLTASILAYPLGKLSDRVGRKKLLVTGYLVFSAVYLGFAVGGSKNAIIAVFVIYGLYTALTAGVERAFITDIAPPELKGTMLGLHSTVVGIALLPASIIAGGIWDMFGPKAPFFFGSFLSLCAAAVLMLFLNKGRAPVSAAGKNG